MQKIKGLIKKKVGGFTLVELIFEIFVLSVLIIPTALLLGHLSLNVSDTETNSTASLLCIQKAEELLWNYDFDTIENALVANPVSFGPPYENYFYKVERQYVDSVNPDTAVVISSYKKISLTVSHSGIPDVVVSLLFVDL
jgi:competence protein ComGC